jgi:cell division protein FtsI/penicillin-binding protein 2
MPYAEDVERLTDPDREGRGLPVLSGAEARRLLVGSSGLEATYDESLRGVPGRFVRVLARPGEERPDPIVLREVEDGSAVRTTLVRAVQEAAHEVVTNAQGAAAAAVVLDVRDGAVVAMASRSDDGLNHAVARLSPGSVHKLATALAVLESPVDPRATADCAGSGWMRPGVRYKCTGVHPGVSLGGAFAGSCNLYFMQRAEAVGFPALEDAYRRLGLSAVLDVGVGPPVGSGPRRGARDAVRLLGIGQGPIDATPLHVATAYARLAAGGRTIVPYLDRDRGPDPATGEIDPVLARRAAELLEAARRVVLDGTARRIDALRALDAAGKSGTAEIDLPREPGDPPGRPKRTNNAWFVGFAPASAPRYVAVVVHERVSGHGAELAGPDVARLLETALRER